MGTKYCGSAKKAACKYQFIIQVNHLLVVSALTGCALTIFLALIGVFISLTFLQFTYSKGDFAAFCLINMFTHFSPVLRKPFAGLFIDPSSAARVERAAKGVPALTGCVSCVSADCREILLPLMTDQLKFHLEKREEPKACCQLLSDILEVLYRKDVVRDAAL